MRSTVFALILGVTASACNNTQQSEIPLSGQAQASDVDTVIDLLVSTAIRDDQRLGIGRLTEDEYRCSARRAVDQLGAGNFEDALNGITESATYEKATDVLRNGIRECSNVEDIAATTTPTNGLSDEEWEKRRKDLRADMVKMLIEWGTSPEEAEAIADQQKAEDLDIRIVEDQPRIWEDWMNFYPLHPVVGNQWTESDAQCILITMIKERGIYETDRQITVATAGGMAQEDAEFLVRPVAECADLKNMYKAELLQRGFPHPECMLSNVTEEQIISWHVALFVEGHDRMSELLVQDINQTCSDSRPL